MPVPRARVPATRRLRRAASVVALAGLVASGCGRASRIARDFDVQFIYRLDDANNLRADFRRRGLVRLIRECSVPSEDGIESVEVKLEARRR